jgi:hypothetical protein
MLHSQRVIFLFAIVFAMIFAFSENALTGQFQRIGAIPDGGELQFHASPKNFGNIMETDFYQFESVVSDFFDTFRCRIVSNGTGIALTLRAFDSADISRGACTTSVNGVCAVSSPFFVNGLSLCTVSPALGGGQSAAGHYIIAIGRP